MTPTPHLGVGARQGASVGRRGASPTPHCRHTLQKATIIGRALDVPVGSSSSAAGGSSSSAGGGSSVAGAAVGHSSVTPWRITRVGASPVQVCLPRWCQACTPWPAMFEPVAFAAGAFSVPPKGPSLGVRCHAFVERFVGVMHGRARGGMFAHANPTIGISYSRRGYAR